MNRHPIIVLAVLGLLALAACGKQPPAPATPRPTPDAAAASRPIRIPAETRLAAGLEVAEVAAGTLRDTVPLYGEIVAAADRMHRVAARYPGIAGNVRKQPGDAVKAGELLLTVESNDSLEPYRITAPAAGRVIERLVNNGESLGSQTLFVIGDLSTVWAELTLFPQDAQKLRVGQAVEVRADGQPEAQPATIVFIGQVSEGERRCLIARVALDNRSGRWLPGQAVAADVVLAERRAGIVIPASAVQAIDGRDHVFVETAAGFEPRPVKLGARDHRGIEVLDGLQAGERIAVGNSYLLKSEWMSRSDEG